MVSLEEAAFEPEEITQLSHVCFKNWSTYNGEFNYFQDLSEYSDDKTQIYK